MRKMNKFVSAVILVAFLINTFLSDTGFAQELISNRNASTLATAARTDDMLGMERQSLSMISMWFRTCLAYLDHQGFPVTAETIKDPNRLPDSYFEISKDTRMLRATVSEDPVTGIITINVTRREGLSPKKYVIEYMPGEKRLRVYPEGAKVPAMAPRVIWLSPEEATAALNAIPNISNVEGLKELSAWAEKHNPSYLAYLEKFKPGLKQIMDILRRTRPVDDLNKLVDENALIMEGETAKDDGIRNRQIRRLDILRGVSELILQLVPETSGVDNIAHLANIKEIFAKHPEFSRSLVNYFETRFDPKKNLNERGKAAGKIRLESILKMLRTNLKESTPEEHFILEKAIRIMIATMKTNYYVEERVNLLFRINPRAIVGDDESGALVNTPPSGLIWVHVPYGAYGAHSRYIDDARGGLRCMEPKDIALLNQVLATCGALTVVQNDKHMDIPEAGSKGAYIYKEGLNSVAAAIGYIDGLITCMREDDYDRIAVSSDVAMIDPLYLGPDVGTGEFADIATALAWMKGLEKWQLLMTGKSQVLGGVSHKSNNLLNPPEKGNNVTSQGVMKHITTGMTRYLRDTGKIVSKDGEPVSVKITGGPNGDVAGGLIKGMIAYYGDNANIQAIVDASGVIFDPNPKGLDHESLLALCRSDSTVDAFPANKLHKGGFVAKAKPGAGEDSYIVLEGDSLQYMNTRALDPDELKRLGVEKQYKASAKLKDNEPLITVLERDSKGHPSKVRVHTTYMRDAMFFIVKSDMLLTGSTGKDNINQANWPLFLDWDGKAVSAGIVHGANVFIHNSATVELEKNGVVIEPDEKANSVGVEISSRVEIDFNQIFNMDEMTRRLLASYFEQVLAKSLENAVKKFWALRIEAEDHPGESVVTKVSPRISTEVIELASRISRSRLIGDRKSDYDAIALKYLQNYFPDVSGLDKKYPATLDRVFERMPVSRLKAIASKAIAKDIVLNLGTGAVSELARQTGLKQIDIIAQYLKVSDEMNVNSLINKVIDNSENLSPRQQIAKLKEIRTGLKASLVKALTSAPAAKIIDAARQPVAEKVGGGFAMSDVLERTKDLKGTYPNLIETIRSILAQSGAGLKSRAALEAIGLKSGQIDNIFKLFLPNAGEKSYPAGRRGRALRKLALEVRMSEGEEPLEGLKRITREANLSAERVSITRDHMGVLTVHIDVTEGGKTSVKGFSAIDARDFVYELNNLHIAGLSAKAESNDVIQFSPVGNFVGRAEDLQFNFMDITRLSNVMNGLLTIVANMSRKESASVEKSYPAGSAAPQLFNLTANIYKSQESMAEAAAMHAFIKVWRRLAENQKQGKDWVVVNFATGRSQLEFLKAFVTRVKAADEGYYKVKGGEKRYYSDRIRGVHLDEYSDKGFDVNQHPASFKVYLRDRLVSPLGLKDFMYVGDYTDTQYMEKIKELGGIDVTFCGIGENGHLGFNDPPADFNKEGVITVTLSRECRVQQVHDWPAIYNPKNLPLYDGKGREIRKNMDKVLENVPQFARTMTVKTIVGAKDVIVVIPLDVKADAVKKLHDTRSLDVNVPSTYLRTNPNVNLFLDQDSSGLLFKGQKSPFARHVFDVRQVFENDTPAKGTKEKSYPAGDALDPQDPATIALAVKIALRDGLYSEAVFIMEYLYIEHERLLSIRDYREEFKTEKEYKNAVKEAQLRLDAVMSAVKEDKHYDDLVRSHEFSYIKYMYTYLAGNYAIAAPNTPHAELADFVQGSHDAGVSPVLVDGLIPIVNGNTPKEGISVTGILNIMRNEGFVKTKKEGYSAITTLDGEFALNEEIVRAIRFILVQGKALKQEETQSERDNNKTFNKGKPGYVEPAVVCQQVIDVIIANEKLDRKGRYAVVLGLLYQYHPKLAFRMLKLKDLLKTNDSGRIQKTIDALPILDEEKTSLWYGLAPLEKKTGEKSYPAEMNRPMKRIGILTGGGTAAGHNAIIYAAALEAKRRGAELVGIFSGFDGLVDEDLVAKARVLDLEELDRAKDFGGTVLGADRINPYSKENVAKGIPEIIWKNIKRLNLDGLIVAGGDDTNSAGGQLSKEHDNFPVIGVSKTMDNDLALPNNARTYGYDTWVTYAVEQARKIEENARSHKRAMVIETFGRNSGFAPLGVGMSIGAARTLIPEEEVDLEKLVEDIRTFYEKYGYAVVVVSEGMSINPSAGKNKEMLEKAFKKDKVAEAYYTSVKDHDSFGHPKLEGAGRIIAAVLNAYLPFKTTEAEKITYAPRTATPTFSDFESCILQGCAAVERLFTGNFGNLLYTDQGEVRSIPFSNKLGGRRVDIKGAHRIQYMHANVAFLFRENVITRLSAKLKGIVDFSDAANPVITDHEAYRRIIPELAYESANSSDSIVRAVIQELILKTSSQMGAARASTQRLYLAKKAIQDKLGRKFTIPSINLRCATADEARIVFETAVQHKVGALQIEIAPTEVAYTGQTLKEFAASVTAGAIMAGYKGAILLKLDHLRMDTAKYKEDAEKEIQRIYGIMKEGIEAGFYAIDIDASVLEKDPKAVSDPEEQQRDNFTVSARLVEMARTYAKDKGIELALGVEVGEVGEAYITERHIYAFLGNLATILNERSNKVGWPIKMPEVLAIPSGTPHGGLRDPKTGEALKDVDIAFDLLETASDICDGFGMVGPVQHGASKLPIQLFDMFPGKRVTEIHLATALSDIEIDSILPDDVRESMLSKFASSKAAADIQAKRKAQGKEPLTPEALRKNTERRKLIKEFKDAFWRVPDLKLALRQKMLGDLFGNWFRLLGIEGTADAVRELYAAGEKSYPAGEVKLEIDKQLEKLFEFLAKHAIEKNRASYTFTGVALSLDLSNTRVSDIADLYKIYFLRDLNLSNTQVSDMSIVCSLLDLQELNLSGTKVSDINPIAPLNKLVTLDLSGTNVSDISVLTKLPNLKYLNLTDTNVTTRQIFELFRTHINRRNLRVIVGPHKRLRFSNVPEKYRNAIGVESGTGEKSYPAGGKRAKTDRSVSAMPEIGTNDTRAVTIWKKLQSVDGFDKLNADKRVDALRKLLYHIQGGITEKDAIKTLKGLGLDIDVARRLVVTLSAEEMLKHVHEYTGLPVITDTDKLAYLKDSRRAPGKIDFFDDWDDVFRYFANIEFEKPVYQVRDVKTADSGERVFAGCAGPVFNKAKVLCSVEDLKNDKDGKLNIADSVPATNIISTAKGTDISEPPLNRAEVRLVSDLGVAMIDQSAVDQVRGDNRDAYYMQRGVFASPKDIRFAFENRLTRQRFDITIIRPGTFGVDDEFIHTSGHYHLPKWKPEIYQVVYGHAAFTLQKTVDPYDTDGLEHPTEIDKAIVVEAEAGDPVVILPSYGHVSTNLDPKRPLILVNWLTWDQESQYGAFVRGKRDDKTKNIIGVGGACWYAVLGKDGKVEYRQNPNTGLKEGKYQKVPDLKVVRPKNVPALGLRKGSAIYDILGNVDNRRDRERFLKLARYLNDPRVPEFSDITPDTVFDEVMEIPANKATQSVAPAAPAAVATATSTPTTPAALQGEAFFHNVFITALANRVKSLNAKSPKAAEIVNFVGTVFASDNVLRSRGERTLSEDEASETFAYFLKAREPSSEDIEMAISTLQGIFGSFEGPVDSNAGTLMTMLNVLIMGIDYHTPFVANSPNPEGGEFESALRFAAMAKVQSMRGISEESAELTGIVATAFFDEHTDERIDGGKVGEELFSVMITSTPDDFSRALEAIEELFGISELQDFGSSVAGGIVGFIKMAIDTCRETGSSPAAPAEQSLFPDAALQVTGRFIGLSDDAQTFIRNISYEYISDAPDSAILDILALAWTGDVTIQRAVKMLTSEGIERRSSIKAATIANRLGEESAALQAKQDVRQEAPQAPVQQGGTDMTRIIPGVVIGGKPAAASIMTSGEGLMRLEDIMKLVPADWLDGWLKIDFLARALNQAGCEQNIVTSDNNSTLIFSEKATFGEYKDGQYEEGIGIILPNLIRSGIRVAVVATTDKQKALIDELNAGKPLDQQIIYAESIPAIMADRRAKAARFYYFKVASESEAGSGVTSITIIVKKILEAIGNVAQIADEKIMLQMHEAARRFAIAA